jgi:hypothetical protein
MGVPASLLVKDQLSRPRVEHLADPVSYRVKPLPERIGLTVSVTMWRRGLCSVFLVILSSLSLSTGISGYPEGFDFGNSYMQSGGQPVIHLTGAD